MHRHIRRPETHQSGTADPITRHRTTIWFATKFPDQFSVDRVADISQTILRNAKASRLPCGAFVYSPFQLPRKLLTFNTLMAGIGTNTVAPGFIIPTGMLDGKWRFTLPTGNEIISYLRAISLMVSLRMPHVASQPEFVGCAQPLLALSRGEGTCFERASILAAVFRLNGITVRIVGHTDMLPGELPVQCHHWWVQAKIGDRWENFDAFFHPDALTLASPALPSRLAANPDAYLEAIGFLEFLQGSAGVPLSVISTRAFSRFVENPFIAPEMDLPEKYNVRCEF